MKNLRRYTRFARRFALVVRGRACERISMFTRFALTTAVLAVFGCDIFESPGPANFSVVARAETEPTPRELGDVAIWRAPTYPSQSMLVATDKSGGLLLYDIGGTLTQTVLDGQMHDLDLRTDVDLGGEWGVATLIAASNQTNDTIDLYTIDPGPLLLARITAVPSVIGEPHGLCIYRSPLDDRIHVFVADRAGQVAQYEFSAASTKRTLLHLRTLTLGAPLADCVADDELARLYFAEEDLGIWRVGAEPTDPAEPMLIDDMRVAGDPEPPDLAGLTIYYGPAETVYLIAAREDTGVFTLYERGGDNAFVTSFAIVTGALDAAIGTEGIAVTNLPMGPLWPNGLFVAQDDFNDDLMRNIKLVDWADIVSAADVELLLDTNYSPW